MTMGEKRSTGQAVLDALRAHPLASAAEVAEAAGIGRSSAGKQLAALERAGRATHHPGGREGGERLPDRWAVAGKKEDSAGRQVKGSDKRLRPGQLDGLVLAFMTDHREDDPLTASAIGKGIERSSGAVANCLKRLAETGRVREASERPHRYVTGV
jgi:hypothetical protein